MKAVKLLLFVSAVFLHATVCLAGKPEADAAWLAAGNWMQIAEANKDFLETVDIPARENQQGLADAAEEDCVNAHKYLLGYNEYQNGIADELACNYYTTAGDNEFARGETDFATALGHYGAERWDDAVTYFQYAQTHYDKAADDYGVDAAGACIAAEDDYRDAEIHWIEGAQQ